MYSKLVIMLSLWFELVFALFYFVDTQHVFTKSKLSKSE